MMDLTKGTGWLVDREAWNRAENLCKVNQLAYFRAYANWEAETFDGAKYNYIHYLPATQEKVFCNFDFEKGLISRSRSTPCKISVGSWDGSSYPLTADGKTVKTWLQTYCNMLISVFTWEFFGRSLCYHDVDDWQEQLDGETKQDGPEWQSANAMHIKLAQDGYRGTVEEGWFRPASYQEATRAAAAGALALASWYDQATGKPGHIAVLTGAPGDGSPGGLEIFQAGLTFGRMSLAKGFGADKIQKIKFYIWSEK